MIVFVDQLYIYRRLNCLGALIAAACVCFSFFYIKKQISDPSPLYSLVCILNLTLLTSFLLAFVHHPRPSGQKTYAFINLIFCVIGLTAVSLQLWNVTQGTISHQGCSLSAAQTFADVGVKSGLYHIFNESTRCSVDSWRLLGLSVAELSLLNMGVLFLISWKLLRQPIKQRSLFK